MKKQSIVPSVLSLAQELIRCPSVTPEDAGCQAIVRRYLEACGFTVEDMPYGVVHNLWARRGTGGPLLVFLGHTDVVPVGLASDWRFPPFEPTLHEGKLYGRGSADMKGSVAAMMVACARFFARHTGPLAGSVGLLITGDEEGPAVDGTAKVLETLSERGVVIDYALVGEASSEQCLGDTVKIGRRGSLHAHLVVQGVQGHIAYPQLAENPIQALAPALVALTQEVWDTGNEHFPPTSFQISNIQGGTGAQNVIPGHVTCHMNFRYAPDVTPLQLQERVCAILDWHKLNYRIDWCDAAQPFLSVPGPLLQACQKAIAQIIGITPECSTAGGTSDGRFVARWGAEVVELGLVNATIHQVNECITLVDLERLVLTYETILELLLLP